MIPVKNKTKNQKCRKFLKRNHYSTLKWFLQAMQNAAIESRTQLRLESEIEEQKAKLADFKLSKEQERTKLGKGYIKSFCSCRVKQKQIKVTKTDDFY